MPGGFDIVIDTGQFHLVVFIDLSMIRSALPEEGVANLERAAYAYLLPAETETVESFGAWLLGPVGRSPAPPRDIAASRRRPGHRT